MNQRLAHFSMILALLFVAPISAHGQKPPPDSLAVQDTLPLLLTGLSVSVRRVTSTTGGSSAVTASLDSMTVTPTPTLEEVLREMPLVQIRANSRGEAQPALRGAEDRQIAVLVDGVPITLSWDQRSDLSLIPLTAAERITLRRGASSLLQGPNALGGAVEIDISRSPEAQRRPDPLSFSASLDDTGGRSLGVMGGTLIPRSSSEWVIRAGGAYRERNGFNLPSDALEYPGQRPQLLSTGEDRRLNSDSRQFDGFLTGRYLSDSGKWFSATVLGYEAERGVPPEAHVDDPRLWRYPSQSRVTTALSAGTGETDSGSLEISFGVDTGSSEIDSHTSELFNEVDETEVGDDLNFTTRVLGTRDVSDNGRLQIALTYADVSHDETIEPVNERSSFRQRLWSAGSEFEWRFTGSPEGPSTAVSMGVAVDGADTPESGGRPPLATLWDWGAKAGISTLLPGEEIRLHGGWSRRARFPGLRELYSGALGRFIPNPNLTAESLTSLEGGVTFQRSGFEFQAVGFLQDSNEGIQRISVDTEEGRKFMRVNRDGIRSIGLELLASGAVGIVNYSTDLTLQRTRLRDPEPGETDLLEYEPAVAGKGAVSLPIWAGIHGSVELIHRGQQHCLNSDSGALQSVDASTSVDLELGRAFQWTGGGSFSTLDVMAGLGNLSDAVVFDQCGLPQPGRTFSVRFRVR